jgi:hypothetical protein
VRGTDAGCERHKPDPSADTDSIALGHPRPLTRGLLRCDSLIRDRSPAAPSTRDSLAPVVPRAPGVITIRGPERLISDRPRPHLVIMSPFPVQGSWLPRTGRPTLRPRHDHPWWTGTVEFRPPTSSHDDQGPHGRA